MNTTLITAVTNCCPNYESFVKEIASNGSDVAIVSIICLTVLISSLTIIVKLFDYLNTVNESKQNNIRNLENKIDGLQEKIETLLNKKKNAEEKLQLAPEQKEMNRFLDFCYEMAKSTAMADQTIKKECWDILKKRYPIETKKENEK